MSGLRCKPGDMALTTGSLYAHNNGKLVTVLRPYKFSPSVHSLEQNVWEIDTVIAWSDGPRQACPYQYLMPIRGGLSEEDMKDESTKYDNQDIGASLNLGSLLKAFGL